MPLVVVRLRPDEGEWLSGRLVRHSSVGSFHPAFEDAVAVVRAQRKVSIRVRLELSFAVAAETIPHEREAQSLQSLVGQLPFAAA